MTELLLVIFFVVGCKLDESIDELQKLPSSNQWIVHEDETLIAGKMPSYTRSKSILGLNKVSTLKCRQISITKHGFLVVYENESEGYVLNIRQAEAVSTSTEHDRNRKELFRRCHVKIKYSFGTLNLLIISNQISQWKQAICGIYEENIHQKKDISTAIEEIVETDSAADVTNDDNQAIVSMDDTKSSLLETKISDIYPEEFVFIIDVIIT